MEDLIIKGSHGNYFIPSVNFNATSGELEIAGESYLEDTVEFYEPILKWIEDFAATKQAIKLDIKLKYFNTSSSRSILDILNLVKDYEDNGGSVTVTWYCKHFDSEMKEEVEDYRLDTGLEIAIELVDEL